LENLLTSIDFTVNALAYDVGEQKLVENGCSDVIQARSLAFNTGRIHGYPIDRLSHSSDRP
jgi:hypothetical protein